MKTLDEVISLYHQIINETQQELNNVSHLIYRVGTMRLIVFASGITGIICFRNESYVIIAGLVAQLIMSFS
ncbi:hypothetical protein EZS27_021572 [termite gut metagenome]|uniref:Uncharacterized protein n=1 Tax=termite gut metagenome TaxID=433724 RepID=A0A5J4R7S1_9ZZZZ